MGRVQRRDLQLSRAAGENWSRRGIISAAKPIAKCRSCLRTVARSRFARFDGMFAIAIWDDRRQRMVLARDPHGKKPLFYYYRPGGPLVFGSTLRPIAIWPDVPRAIDESSIYEYMKIGYLHAPRSLLADTYKVRPGTT